MRIFINAVAILILLLPPFTLLGQRQLIVLKGEDVLFRVKVGDPFVYRLKDSKDVTTTQISALADSAVITLLDTIPLRHIDRVYFRQHKFYNTVGVALVIFGGGLFAVDQFNEVVINGRDPNLDEDVSRLSLGALAIGIPMMLLKKKSEKIRGRVQLMTVDPGSVFHESGKKR